MIKGIACFKYIVLCIVFQKIAVLQLAGKYQQKYKREFRPESFGFKTPNELLKTIRQLDLVHDEMLALWFLTFNPNAPPEVEEVMEVEQEEVAEAPKNGDANNSDQENHAEGVAGNEGGAEGNGNAAGIIVLEETEDVEMKAPSNPVTKDRPKLPDLPAPTPSISSMASSTVSNCSKFHTILKGILLTI